MEQIEMEKLESIWECIKTMTKHFKEGEEAKENRMRMLSIILESRKQYANPTQIIKLN